MSNYVDVEGMMRAARAMDAAAEKMQHAASNMHAAVDRAEQVWAGQIAPDMAALTHRLEEVKRRG